MITWKLACVNNIMNDIIYMYLLNAATNFNNFRMDASGKNDSIQQRPKSNNAWISILHLFLPTVRNHLKIYSQCKPLPDQAVMDLFLKQVLVSLSIPLVHSVKILLSIFLYRSCNSCLYHRRCAI